ncbi:MAG: AarF/ABC1/UbiB kinase family protein [Proteobacteria bacterium]|nr:AarF/ABC1/UbiB kinase family protein [Pseudomonadota bacterium]
MNFSKKTHRVRHIKRFAVISRIMVKHGLGGILDRIFDRNDAGAKVGDEKPVFARTIYPSPRRIRRVFEELGPTFVKLGQLMSTRADMFPPEYLEEFKKLQDRVPPVPFPEIQAVIEKELKHPISEIFVSIEEESLAAASVAQVHMAELAEGELVVVKVIRPGIDKKIREDIRLMYYFAQKLENAFEIGQAIGFVNVVKEFERNIFRELDMYIEAGNTERFGRNFKDSQELYIPKVYWNYISKSILVMEHIEGIRMDRIDEIRAQNIDPKEIAMIGLRSFSRQLMEFGLFHADPHPGNSIVMNDGRLGLVDFGIIGYLDEKTMLEIANVFLGYAEHNYDMVMDALVDAALINEETVNLKYFRNDLRDISEPFYGRSLKNISVKDVYDQVMQLLLKYHIRLPRDLMLLFKTFIQAEALGKILGSDASLLEVTRPYAKKLLKQGYDTQKLVHNIARDFRSTRGYLRVFPKLFHDILKGMTAGKHQIEIRHSGFQQTNAKIERGINRLTVSLIISASLIAGSLVLDSSQKVMEFTIDFFGVHTISITALLGLLGYSLATVLGFWLILSIFRSGKM